MTGRYVGRSGQPITTKRNGVTIACKCECEHLSTDLVVCWKCDCACDPTSTKPNTCRCCGFTHSGISK